MAFLQKQIGGGGFGADLRHLREQRGLSLDDLAQLTTIHSSVILALEEERLQDLCDPRYEERHVRAIVMALEGHPNYFLKKYRELLEQRGVQSSEGLSNAAKRLRRRDFFVTSHAVALVGFLVVVGITAGYLIWQGHHFQQIPLLDIVAPAEGLHLSVPRVDVYGRTDPTASVAVNGRPAVVDPVGNFSLTFDIPRGLTTLTIEARRRFGSSNVETRRVTYDVGNDEAMAPDVPTDVMVSSTTSTR